LVELPASIPYPDHGGSTFLWNVSTPLPDYVASHLSIQESSPSQHENLTSGNNIHYVVFRQANFLMPIVELRAVYITTEEWEI
jgi:hypothetical protein